jgi:acyl-CoA synthetase (AMP-forming)/AMP-acid ligase II
MTSPTPARQATEAVLAAETLCEAFQLTACRDPDATALVNHGGGERVTWAQYSQRVRAVTAGLYACGARPRDTIAILLRNRPVFNIVDTAVLHAGAVPFSLYHTEPVEQMVALVRNSGDAKAARRAVVASLDGVLDNAAIREYPAATTLPGYLVTHVVEAPFGAHPGSSHGVDRDDEDHLREYLSRRSISLGRAPG